MTTPPLIGISGSIEHDESKQFIMRDYFTAILASGGIPLLLSMDMDKEQLKSCLSVLSGVLLAGGGDADPGLFGENPHPALGEVDPLRDRFEWRLLEAASERGLPVFGICRGMQMMNLAAGGTIYQDIAAEYALHQGQPPILHRQTALPHYPCHEVRIEAGSLLASWLSVSAFSVNSFHHQAVRKAAPGLRACAHAPDGMVEAIEDPSKAFWLGVQWHPERMYRKAGEAKGLFEAFVRAASAYAAEA